MTVLELLSDEKRWTRGTRARDKNKKPCEPKDTIAESFCLMGAIQRCYSYDEYFDALDEVELAIDDNRIGAFNDDPPTTHADILRVVREAGI